MDAEAVVSMDAIGNFSMIKGIPMKVVKEVLWGFHKFMRNK